MQKAARRAMYATSRLVKLTQGVAGAYHWYAWPN